MKWAIGILVALNILVFILASMATTINQSDASISAVPTDTPGIRLLDSRVTRLPGNCFTIGPIEKQIVMDRFKRILASETSSYRLISEAPKKILAYRVSIPLDESSDVDDLRQRLNKAGITDSYEKTLADGTRMLSLGVFSYKNTANDLAKNLAKVGFGVKSEREYLTYPLRYWVNLNQSLDASVLTDLNQYVESNIKIQQHSAKCL